MTTAAHFARLVARPIDRVSIAGMSAVMPAQLEELGVNFSVPASAAAMVVGFLPPDGITTEELGAVLRYVPSEMVTGLTGQLSQAGLLTVTDGGARYTEEGQRCAQAIVDAQPQALADAWLMDVARLEHMRGLLASVAGAAVRSGRLSPLLYARPLQPTNANAAYDLWRSVTIARRFRADCHAQAWAEAGHTASTIAQLGQGSERQLIEDRTDELNAPIWSDLSELDQLDLLAGLGGLNGVGNPS